MSQLIGLFSGMFGALGLAMVILGQSGSGGDTIRQIGMCLLIGCGGVLGFMIGGDK